MWIKIRPSLWKKRMRFSAVLSFILFLPSFVLSCGGGASAPKAPEVRFDFSDTQALVLSNSSSSSPLLNSQAMDALTTDEAISNLRKLASDGTLKNVIETVESDGGQKRKVTYPVVVETFKISPAGEIFVEFSSVGVTLGESVCRLVVVRPPSTAECLPDSDLVFGGNGIMFSFFGSGLEFDNAGNAYLTTSHLVAKRSSDGRVSLLFNGKPVNFSFSENSSSSLGKFQIAPDGSIIAKGSLPGIGDNFFRIIPELNRIERLNPNLEALLGLSTGSAKVYDFDIFQNGKVYVSSTYGIFVGSFSEDGSLSFDLIPGSDLLSIDSGATTFTMNAAGEVFGVDKYTPKVVRLEPSIVDIDFAGTKIELFQTVGDFLYFTGTNSAGEDVFIRKRLSVDGEELDLLGGRNLVVQKFDVSDNGDVYFGALDLDTTTAYLYKYSNQTGELETLSVLPNDLMDFVLMPGSF